MSLIVVINSPRVCDSLYSNKYRDCCGCTGLWYHEDGSVLEVIFCETELFVLFWKMWGKFNALCSVPETWSMLDCAN